MYRTAAEGTPPPKVGSRLKTSALAAYTSVPPLRGAGPLVAAGAGARVAAPAGGGAAAWTAANVGCAVGLAAAVGAWVAAGGAPGEHAASSAASVASTSAILNARPRRNRPALSILGPFPQCLPLGSADQSAGWPYLRRAPSTCVRFGWKPPVGWAVVRQVCQSARAGRQSWPGGRIA